jgi:uncharacterized protein YjbI with pentapeptide repeats
MAIDPKDLGELQRALNDAAGKASVLWTTFVIFQLYLAIAFGSVTHLDLFLEKPIKLPLLNVDLPLVGFFAVAPTVLLIFHFYVFLQLAGLASKANDYNTLLVNDAPIASDRQYIRQRLDVFPILQFLAGPRDRRTGFSGFSLRLITWITLVATPLLILLQGQVTFLPYHQKWVVWLQRFTVLIDLAIVWYFWVRLRSDNDQTGWMPQKAKLYLGGAGTLCVLIFSLYLATFPGEWVKTHLPELALIPTTDDRISLHALLFEGDVDVVSGRPLSFFSNRLVLNNQSIVDLEKFDKITVSHRFRGRDLRLAVLILADLRKADFTGAQLQGASLLFAQLQGASLFSAQLQGAFLVGAQLQGAVLNGAQLQGAVLDGAQLQGAVLDGAQLQGASLWSAQLQGAFLLGAQLQGASLDEAQLQGAVLDGAQLQGASLWSAELQGASLDEAQLQGASLDGARVWRARGGFRMSLVDVAEIDTDTMPWETESTFAAWRDARLQTIPKERWQAVSNRLSALGEEPKDVLKAQFWKDALSALPQGEEREKQLATLLADLGCSVNDDAVAVKYAAPHVARGLIANGRLRSTGPQIAPVADRFRKGKSDSSACPGVRGFTDDDWAKLDQLVTGVLSRAADEQTK